LTITAAVAETAGLASHLNSLGWEVE
jgi:hypothetical protein